jgi:hypothetical protein
MAVTIHTTPKQWSPSDNPLNFTFSSNMTGQANFSYVVETYYNTVKVAEDRVFPESGARAHYDCAPIISGLMPQPQIRTALWQDAAINGSVYVIVRESYGTPPALQASATSSTIKIFKAALSDDDWQIFDAPVAWQNLKFLTNYPRTQRLHVLRNQNVFLNQITDALKQLAISLYRADTTLIGTYTDTQNYPVAQVCINATNLQMTAGFSPAEILESAYFTVRIGTSEIFTVHWHVQECRAAHALQWLNEYGAFDSFIFAHNLERTGNVNALEFGRQFGAWNGTSFVYDAELSGTQRSKTNTERGGIVYTDWIEEAQQHWLTELYSGTVHRLVYSTGVQKGIKITSNQFTFKQQRFEELLSEAVAFDFVAMKQSAVR